MASRGIREFMWAFQPHFRANAESFINDVLKRIGLPTAPEVILIGFREAGEGPNPICVEPENGKYPSGLFADVLEAAEDLFAVRPDKDTITTDARLHESRTTASREKARRAAIASSLERATLGLDRYFFVGVPSRVADYRVYPVVGVLKSRWDTAPALPADPQPPHARPGDTGYPRSLQHAVMREGLREMTMALSMSAEPQDLRNWSHELAPETVRTAANSFARGIVACYGSIYGGDLFNSMNAVSAQPYEGRTGIGTLLIGRDPRHSSDFEVDIDFRSDIKLPRTRALRKALELTDTRLALLTDGDVASGLGRIRGTGARTDVFEVTVTGRGQWGLGTPGLPLLAVENGAATLPRDRISRASFIDTVDRVFNGAGDGNALWMLTEAAVEQQHGTMLVVRTDAELEAERLAPQALAITPRQLDPMSLASLTAIDGAILVGPDAQCHAVGVILDGQAIAGVGDPSRGARYNSALRYHQGATPGTTLIVIVSEDGMINLLPNLRRRVSRNAVEKAVRALVAAATDPVDFEQAWKRSEHVRSLAFYLSAEQANDANAAFEAIEQARERSVGPGETGITRVGYTKLTPNLEMNESYFLGD
ncbi:hypothetical protein [Microbacterium paraoxydans]|uniref:hypothetical protein n=1 Tax=Microbacterium paraoxydans TaxID=199592 RepID=UPI0021A875FF|nr:hypothetical protein [Microbacterium paraoxydans]MCT2225310.1 hypothetical protein [Microbacterium paraoxydans]